MEAPLKFIEIQKRTDNYVRSLLSEGYMVRFQSRFGTFTLLQHQSNGNFMQLLRVGEYLHFRKNGKLIKTEKLL